MDDQNNKLTSDPFNIRDDRMSTLSLEICPLCKQHKNSVTVYQTPTRVRFHYSHTNIKNILECKGGNNCLQTDISSTRTSKKPVSYTHLVIICSNSESLQSKIFFSGTLFKLHNSMSLINSLSNELYTELYQSVGLTLNRKDYL